MKNKFSIAMSLAVMVAMLVTSLALADVVTSDVVATTGNQTFVDLGNVSPGQVITSATSFQLVCNGNNHADQGNTVNVQFFSVSPAGNLTATNATIGPIPASWTDDATGPDNCPSPAPVLNDNGDSAVTITAPNTAGTYDYVVTYKVATSGGIDSNDVTGSIPAVTFRITVVAPPSDTTPPVITKTISGTLGNNNWYTSDVTIDWTVTDPESSFTMVGCVDTTINSDTSGTTSSCSATSTGGTSSDSVTVMRDATAPTGVTGAPDRAPDSGTWYNQAVDVVFTGSDATSGIASCTTTNYSGPDGAAVTANGSCTDNAGNTGTGVSNAFDYDASGPTGVALSVTAGTAGANGWYTSDVTVSTTGSDNVSGVTCTGPQSQTTETAGAVLNGSCTNGAGLTTNAAPLTVKLDKTGPSASLSASGTLGSNGWYTSDVSITTTGSDTISNPTTCTPDQSQTTDTASATFNGSCTNDAGLSTNAASLTIKRDATAPTSISFVGGPAAGGSYYFGSVPSAPTCTADGAISGLASCTVSGHGTTVGAHTMTATATDNAGNSGTATRSYTVLAWTFNGFYNPVDMNGVYNTVRGGSTVPLKFEVFAGSTELTATSVVQSFVQTRIACDGTLPTDEIEIVTTGGTSLRYDATAGQFIQNWQTPRQAGACYRVTMTTQDGSSLVAFFRLK